MLFTFPVFGSGTRWANSGVLARKNKIKANAYISLDNIISAPDIDSVYEVPINFELDQLGKKVLKKLHLKPKKEPDFSSWKKLVDNIKHPSKKITIAIIGKYVTLGDYDIAVGHDDLRRRFRRA